MDCPRSIGSRKADTDVSEKVCRAINQPEILLAQARNLVDELHASSDTWEQDRQCVIAQARKGSITEEDIGYQLGAIDMQALSLKRELATVRQAVNIQLLGDWESMVREYLADL